MNDIQQVKIPAAVDVERAHAAVVLRRIVEGQRRRPAAGMHAELIMPLKRVSPAVTLITSASLWSSMLP